MTIAGAVLIGGASRRMGVDKASLLIDGVAMAHRVARSLRAAGVAPVVGIGHQRTLERPEFAVVPDEHPGSGPLGGVITALGWASSSTTVVVLACDLLAPDPGPIRRLVDVHLAAGADVTVPVVDGRPQWLHAAWQVESLAALRSTFDGGVRSLHRGVACVRVHHYDERDAAAGHDADLLEDLPADAIPVASAAVSIPEIDVSSLAARLDDGAVVIDVREVDEYAEVHATGVRLIPLSEVPDRVAEVPTEGPVYVICKSGGRSRKAAEFFVDRGIDAINVAGGTMAWVDAGLPTSSGDTA